MHALLKKYFGFDSFRPLQENIILNVLEKKDSLVLMPTGGGKSLCYQLPALALSGLTLVISPLIALMKDQVDALQANGIAAEFINSSLSHREIELIQQRAVHGQLKILYLAPERLALQGFVDWLKTADVKLIAVDEAHCISEWGHDFRPEYRNLHNLREQFPKIPMIALTATATERVRMDIVDQLKLHQGQTYISSFNRANLNYIIQPKQKTFEKLLNLLKKYRGEPVIVYCFSRKETEALAEKLNKKGHKAAPYHAGLEANARRKTQEKFIRDDISIIVATVAFGMGIDKPDIRLVVHFSLPKSIENYYQETGRAGRDGLPAECVLFYSYGDKIKHDFFINQIADSNERSNNRQKLGDMIKYCAILYCRRKFLLQYFGETSEIKNCGNCDVCKPYEILTPAEGELPETKSALKTPSPVKNDRVPRHFPKTSKALRAKKTLDLPYDPILYEKLRAFRKRISERMNVPPFIVFSNVSLQEMAYYLPQNLQSFGKINGVGREKLRRFGAVFVRHISNYAKEKSNTN